MKSIKYIIVGIVSFLIPLAELLSYCPDQIYNWHNCLRLPGWLGLIGFIVCFVFVILDGLNILKRRK